MTENKRSLLVVAVFASAVSLAVSFLATSAMRGTAVRDYLASHPEDVQRIVKDYFINNPSAMKEIIEAVIAGNGGPPEQVDKTAAIQSNSQQLFSSPHQVTLGNPDGDVTVVEFFDYNCGYCRRAVGDMLALLKDDPKLRIVLKELPILSPGSGEAARVAIAVRMQDEKKYLDFHQKLFEAPGQANKDKAITAAKAAGLDLGQIEKDMASDEVAQTLAESQKLAQALGIDGTPCYVIGDALVLGAVGADALKDKIQSARNKLAAK
jgi:protein-disulfide isomerase